MYKEHFTDKIKQARLDSGYTQQQVADATGISRQTICRIETGKRQPELENLCILIDFYSVSADWILGTNKRNK